MNNNFMHILLINTVILLNINIFSSEKTKCEASTSHMSTQKKEDFAKIDAAKNVLERILYTDEPKKFESEQILKNRIQYLEGRLKIASDRLDEFRKKYPEEFKGEMRDKSLNELSTYIMELERKIRDLKVLKI